jgi:hypothetical protein
MLFGRIPGVRRSRSGVWWSTVAACVLLAGAIVAVMVLIGLEGAPP